MSLPHFKYHPDPLATGNIEKSDNECTCCGKDRGYIYVGPVYAEEEYYEEICPWCIADGSAHRKLQADFHDIKSIGIYPGHEEVPSEIAEEIAFRTPGFSGWQQEQWWTHCGDGAQFLGCVGQPELAELGEQALAAVRENTGLPEGPEWQSFLAALDKNGSPRAYLFRCIHCARFGAYQDCD